MRALAIALLLSCALYAQEFRGAFSGTVTDAQGAAIAKAKVSVTETRTGTRTETESEPSGAYTVPFLAPGTYQIAAEAPGFKKFVRAGVSLDMGAHNVIDIKLDVGAVTEEVTVTADSPLIEPANASIGQVITGEEVENFPTNGGTPLMLAQLALGAISTVEPGTQVRPFDNNTPGSFSLGGAKSGTNELLYNGAPNAGFRNQLAYSPPQGAVQQVAVSVFQSDSSFGHTGGGTTNLITKSGTNELHGGLYEFNQVSALDANQFFYNARGVARPVFRYNQYGAYAGGPLRLPKVYNGKNRVFWFFAWEGLKDSDPANSPRETGSPTNFATVPTDAERKGDLSALLNAGSNYAIYDPTTAVPSGTHVQRTPFPDNIIPASRINPIALKYVPYFPAPNTAGLSNGSRNYLVNAIDSDGYNNELARLDVNLTNKNKLSADFRHSFRTQDKNNYFHNVAEGNKLFRKNQGASVDDVYTISPTLFADVRGNWTRFIEITSYNSDGLNPSDLGFPSYIAANTANPMMPHIIFTSKTVTGGAEGSFQDLGMGTDALNTYDIFQLFGDIVKVHGSHTIKAGADIRDYRWSAFEPGNSAGIFTFNGAAQASTTTSSWTNGPISSSASAPLGQDFAAFLLGLPSTGSMDINAQTSAASRYYSLFVQDDWRARRNLTINLGLRFERETPAYERYNRGVNGFDPTVQNGVTAAAAAAYNRNPVSQIPVGQFQPLGGLTFASAGNPALYQTESHMFSPRFGFAWVPAKLGGKTVIRGGIATFSGPIVISGNGEQNSGTTVKLNAEGFSQTTQLVTDNTYQTPGPGLSNPFSAGIFPPAGASGGYNTYLGQAISFFNPHVRNPYNIRWNFGVQRQLPAQMVLEVVYIGNHALHLPINTDLDYIPPQYLTTSILRDNAENSLMTGTVMNPFAGLLPNGGSLNSANVQLRNLLVLFPQYGIDGITEQSAGAGSSYFQSLNVRLQKRFTNGIVLMNNFIWSKDIERVSYLNPFDPAPEKRVSADSRPLSETLAASYNLPVGRGKRLNLHSRAANALLGGWLVNGIMTFRRNQVLGTWGNVIYYGGPLNFNPNQPNGLAFDTSRFEKASNQQPVYNIRTFPTQFGNLLRAPSENLDFSVSKNFAFTERRYVQIRAEAFNITNHVTFGAPNISVTNAAFGTITTQQNSPRIVQLGARLVF